MTHLLHQMVHHRTTLRGSEQRSATIARITIHTRNDIEYKKKVIRVLRHVVSPAGDPNPQVRLGAGRYSTQRPLERSRGLPLKKN